MKETMVVIIQRGALGVSSNVICGAMAHGQLNNALLAKGRFEVSRAASDCVLSNLGYVRAFPSLRWLGSNHVIWVRAGFECGAADAKAVLNVTARPSIQPYVTIQG